jgi:hypothetical protein
MNTRNLCSLNLRIVVLVGGLCLANGSGALPINSTPVTPRAPKVFEEVCCDPLAAAREGLWDLAVPASAKKKLVFEDVQFDPLAAERSGLWRIEGAAGSGVTVGRERVKQ